MIYFTSDLHFGHNKDFIYEARGFQNIQEHDEALIANINATVTPDDDLYLLGDLYLDDDVHGLECLKKLNGHLHILFGNHDTPNRIKQFSQLENIEILGYATMLKYSKQHIYLSHYPTMTANYSDGDHLHTRVLCFCGHTHAREKFYNDNPYIYNVALDAHRNHPVSIEEILSDIRTEREERRKHSE